jgi:hypothetical protein
MRPKFYLSNKRNFGTKIAVQHLHHVYPDPPVALVHHAIHEYVGDKQTVYRGTNKTLTDSLTGKWLIYID